MQMIVGVGYELEHKLVIRLSSVKIRAICLNVVCTISNAFKVSLTNSFKLFERKNE